MEILSFTLFSLFLLQLTAAIVFLSFGIVTSFLCLMIDGVCIVLNMVSNLHLHVCTATLQRMKQSSNSKLWTNNKPLCWLTAIHLDSLLARSVCQHQSLGNNDTLHNFVHEKSSHELHFSLKTFASWTKRHIRREVLEKVQWSFSSYVETSDDD